QWEEVMGTHKYYMEDRPDAMSYEEENAIVDYMSKYFIQEAVAKEGERREPNAKPDPNAHIPINLAKGLETKVINMEFNLRPSAFPHDISVDSNGVAWIAEHGENEFGITEKGVRGVVKEGVGSFSSIDPESLKYNHFFPPKGKFPSRVSGAAVDPQGVVWAADNSH